MTKFQVMEKIFIYNPERFQLKVTTNKESKDVEN